MVESWYDSNPSSTIIEEDSFLCGVKGINHILLKEQDKITVAMDGIIRTNKEKWLVLETDGINLKTCIVDFKRTYSNSCLEIFNVLDIEAARGDFEGAGRAH
ncbi:hypothetical protein HYPSUDRAFT_209022 [Hypholoma sublateritium FD-334 SS-4]|uniref:Uncharacterized protein n=1 Tax=Hypholoma sublateritium (strain FD-334 SS-4) TaxID=945553 RepID=A0A0D2LTD0_HYPSF|nr:hypothetical protein HYPSUDRAFT_209022 [Hypholoma sublateritium FD-334 SS-4]